jgi:hypothetical protein
MLHGEDPFDFDLDEVLSAVAESEVMVVAFAFCEERLLLDLRANETDGPLIEVVEQLQSASERALWLVDRRPAFEAPEQSAFFLWPHSVAYLEASGFMKAIRARGRAGHGLGVEADLAAVLAELRGKERDYARAVVVGAEGFENLWSRR